MSIITNIKTDEYNYEYNISETFWYYNGIYKYYYYINKNITRNWMKFTEKTKETK